MSQKFQLPDVEELVVLYADDVLRVCNYYLGKRSQAEDAFQDVFLKVLRKKDSFAGDCPPKYWLLSVARNVCKDYLKSSWATRVGSFEQMSEESGEREDPAHFSSPLVTPSVDGRQQEDLYFDSMPPEGSLWDAVQNLPDAYKDVILFRYYCDMDNAAIAKACNITESSVRSRLFRAKKMLSGFEKKDKSPEVVYG
ncbi:MAG: sigma-70 family RNA polymerase sigma factor [Clostridiales bacterium]|jgi:RNA polymerase sigma-70 factor (ECF subfamily)|nr:sigma-70 family RNA polymerase sigma factor [Clostridiales bacterium]HAW16233.1 hypothetical protein [Clostridiales bacterium]